MTSAETLLQQFESAILPKSAWTHEAHLRVAFAMLSVYSHDEALCRMRAGIIGLNRAHGTPNTSDSGYHETLTQFWVTVIHFYLQAGKNPTSASLDRFLQSGLAVRELPIHFYEKEILMATHHRAVYVPATKQALSWEKLQGFIDQYP